MRAFPEGFKEEKVGLLRGQHTVNPEPSRVCRSAFLHHDHQSPYAESRSKSSSTEDPDHSQFLCSCHLNRPDHWNRQKQNPQIASNADDRVSNDDLSLVETLATVGSTQPVCRDRFAEKYLDKERGDVVA